MEATVRGILDISCIIAKATKSLTDGVLKQMKLAKDDWGAPH